MGDGRRERTEEIDAVGSVFCVFPERRFVPDGNEEEPTREGMTFKRGQAFGPQDLCDQ